jgi:hypothetical protein
MPILHLANDDILIADAETGSISSTWDDEHVIVALPKYYTLRDHHDVCLDTFFWYHLEYWALHWSLVFLSIVGSWGDSDMQFSYHPMSGLPSSSAHFLKLRKWQESYF